MKEIKLTQGQVALIDDVWFKELSRFKWCAKKDGNTFYAMRRTLVAEGRKCVYMHHAIMGKPPEGCKTDHKDGNGLHNFTINLRFVTHRQNTQNRKNFESTSKFPGVYWDKNRQKWVASIAINNRNNYLGRFVIEEEAANAYRRAVAKLGEKIIN